MADILENALALIKQYALVFYGVAIFGILIYIGRARAAYRQTRINPFPIEREEAAATVRDAVILMLVFAAIFGTTYYIDRVLLAESEESSGFLADIELPTLPSLPDFFGGGDGDEDSSATPSPGTPDGEETATSATRAGTAVATEDEGNAVAVRATASATSPAIGPTPFQSATPNPSPEAGTATVQPSATTATVAGTPTTTPSGPVPPTATPLPSPTPIPPTAAPPTETPPPIPTDTPPPPPPTNTVPPVPPTQPPAPPVPAASCGTAGVTITSPANGQVVAGSIGIFGTADIPNFQFYKVEYGIGTNTGSFSSIGDTISNPVRNGRLATWNTGGFPRGTYTLRLTVVDVTGNFPPPCVIYVTIQ